MTRRRRSSRPPRRDAAVHEPGVRLWPWLLAALVSLALLATAMIVLPHVRHPGVGRNVDLEVVDGASDAELVARLTAAGVIDHPRLFALYLRLVGGARAQPGRHLLADDLAAAEVLKRLRRSADATRVKVTIPEGFATFDIARRLHDKRVCDGAAFLAAANERSLLDEVGVPARTAEGWLFPATYVLPADGDARAVARAMLQEGKTRIDRLLRDHPAGVDELQRTLGWGPAEIVTLASIVEKEAAVDDERPLIASVFLNRLRDPTFVPHRLQADPTAAYGCWVQSPPSCASYLAAGGGKPTVELEHDPDNDWSSYTHEGLPPTPIASPGERSLVAVLDPARARWLYFVAKGGGRHTFSETLDQHNKAVQGKP